MRIKFSILFFSLFFTCNSFAQFYKSIIPSPEFTNALEKIVLDFRVDYKNIQGEQIEKIGDVEIYESSVKLPGTTECKIMRFHSVQDTTASWQAIAYKGDDYKDAVKAYLNIFRLVKKSHFKWIDHSSVGFTGELQMPREDIRFTTSTLTLELADNRYNNFVGEVELLTTYDGWEVQFNLSKKI
jgi:hypothetical protein